MNHRISPDDEEFRRAFEAFDVGAHDFDHRAHVRLAYVYLCRAAPDEATAAMKRALLAFLGHLGMSDAKFHETMTRAWVGAVDHFMETTAPCASFAEFVAHNAVLLESKIMLSHYSAEVLFSDEARATFVAPDVSPIPHIDPPATGRRRKD